MNKIVAVENNLTPFKEFLTQKGCRVIDIDVAKGESVDAVVISGSRENLLGMQDVYIDAPVINASGKTPEEVWYSITGH
jgi:hypothetical protein